MNLLNKIRRMYKAPFSLRYSTRERELDTVELTIYIISIFLPEQLKLNIDRQFNEQGKKPSEIVTIFVHLLFVNQLFDFYMEQFYKILEQSEIKFEFLIKYSYLYTKIAPSLSEESCREILIKDFLIVLTVLIVFVLFYFLFSRPRMLFYLLGFAYCGVLNTIIVLIIYYDVMIFEFYFIDDTYYDDSYYVLLYFHFLTLCCIIAACAFSYDERFNDNDIECFMGKLDKIKELRKLLDEKIVGLIAINMVILFIVGLF